MQMKKQKHTVGKYVLAIVVFCAVFVAISAIKAGVTENISGWLWGGSEDANISGAIGGSVFDGNEVGIGWISMNSSNCDPDNDGMSEGLGGCPALDTSIANYGVNIPTTGPIIGYAWSENMGYIDFAPHAGCPGSPKYAGACDAYPASPNQDATRNADNTVTGWARFVEMSKASASGNSYGGWIKMSGPTYGVSVSGNSLVGKAWNGEEAGILNNMANGLGYIDFSRSGLPTFTFDANPTFINIETNPNWATTGVDIQLNWAITGSTTCIKSDNNLVWDGSTSISGSEMVHQTKASVTYTLTCSGAGTKNVTVSTGCYPKKCSVQKCANGTLKLGILSLSSCTDVSECTTDSECETKSLGDWKEVAP
jgi:hypothetical protein